MTVVSIPSGRQPPTDDALFERIATDIAARGFTVLPASLPPAIADDLMDGLARLDNDSFHRAAVGRARDETVNKFVRRDRICWIDEDAGIADEWLAWTERLRVFLNRRLFLGLFSFESHYAFYRPGDFYKRHYDAFRGEANRILSVVTYLNKGWLPEQGGELVIYTEDDCVHVGPGFGTVVIFLSEEFPHEVLPATRDRFSVTGWFRLNTSGLDQIDPPR